MNGSCSRVVSIAITVVCRPSSALSFVSTRLAKVSLPRFTLCLDSVDREAVADSAVLRQVIRRIEGSILKMAVEAVV